MTALWALVPNRFRCWLVAGLVLAVAFAGGYRLGRHDERAEARARTAEAQLEHARDAERTADEIRNLGDDDFGDELDRRLRPAGDD